MKTSESLKAIAASLLQAQGNIKAALKDSTNPHFKSKYADLSSVIDAVKKPLNDAGIVFTQGVSSAESGVSVETMLLHVSGEWMSETLTVPVSKHDAQGVGSAITYGRRYGLQSMCGVPAEDDDGNAASAAPPKKTITPTTGLWEALTDEQRTILSNLAGVIKEYVSDQDCSGAYEALDAAGLDADERAALGTQLDSKTRTAMSKWRKENPVNQGVK